jgi:hypothetical protein
MANQKGGSYNDLKSIKRPGVHSKTKTSNNKSNKNYRKAYRGQGK